MNEDFKTPVNRDAQLETLAADLTLAAYRAALRTRTGGTWLDLAIRPLAGRWPIRSRRGGGNCLGADSR